MSSHNFFWEDFDHVTATSVIGDQLLPMTFSDPGSESTAIRHSVGLIDYSGCGYFQVTGAEAVDFVERVFSREVKYVFPAKRQSIAGLLLDGAARMIADAHVYVMDDYYLIETWYETRSRAGSWLREQARAFDVEIREMTDDTAIIGIEGPNAWSLVHEVVEMEDNDVYSLAYRQWSRARCGGAEILIARTGWTAEYGYKLFVPREYASSVWGTLRDSGGSLELKACGLRTIDLCMLEVRFVNLLHDISPDMTPWEAGLMWMIDPFKQDFIGSEALWEHRGRTKASLIGFTSSAAEHEVAIDIGLGIADSKVEVGRVIRVEHSETVGAMIGLAALRRDVCFPGLTLATLDVFGDEIRTISAPFCIPRSWSIEMA